MHASGARVHGVDEESVRNRPVFSSTPPTRRTSTPTKPSGASCPRARVPSGRFAWPPLALARGRPVREPHRWIQPPASWSLDAGENRVQLADSVDTLIAWTTKHRQPQDGWRCGSRPRWRPRASPRPAAEAVGALLRTRRTLLADVDLAVAPRERLLVRTDVSGTVQLQELDAGVARTLTALPEPVASAHYVPGRRQAVLAVDAGGNERHQLYLLELDRDTPADRVADLRALTSDPRFGHQPAGVSPDGRLLAYTSNRANGVDFDLWLCDLEAGEHRLLHAAGTWLHPASGFSPDGRYVAVLASGERPLDEDLVLVDTVTGAPQRPLPHPDEAALVGAPAWVSPTVFYASSNIGRDHAAIVRHDLATGQTTTLAGTGQDSDAEVVAAADGAALVVIENRDGASVMTRWAPGTSMREAEIELPEPGVTAFHFMPAPILTAGGERLYFSLTTPRLGGDVFVHDADVGGIRRLTTSPAPVAPEQLVAPTPPSRAELRRRAGAVLRLSLRGPGDATPGRRHGPRRP